MLNFKFDRGFIVLPQMYWFFSSFQEGIFNGLSLLLPLLNRIQEAKGDKDKLLQIPQGSLYGDFFGLFPEHTFIGISADGEQASIILNIDHPDIVVAYSTYSDNAETISFQDFLYLIQSWVSENKLLGEQGDKYISPQDRPDFQEYHIEVTKTTLSEVLAKFYQSQLNTKIHLDSIVQSNYRHYYIEGIQPSSKPLFKEQKKISDLLMNAQELSIFNDKQTHYGVTPNNAKMESLFKYIIYSHIIQNKYYKNPFEMSDLTCCTSYITSNNAIKNKSKLQDIAQIRPYGIQFFDANEAETMDRTIPYFQKKFIVFAKTPTHSIILNIDNPDIVIAYSHWGFVTGDGYDAEIISFQDFLLLIQSWVSENKLLAEQGDKYISPQDRSDFQEYMIEVTKTTFSEVLASFKLEK